MDKLERKKVQNVFVEKTVENLPMLRASIKLTQNQLAKKLGVTRSTMVAYESHSRPIQWNMYLAIIMVFMQYETSAKLVENFGLYDKKLLIDIM